jgi:hypothetical protein
MYETPSLLLSFSLSHTPHTNCRFANCLVLQSCTSCTPSNFRLRNLDCETSTAKPRLRNLFLLSCTPHANRPCAHHCLLHTCCALAVCSFTTWSVCNVQSASAQRQSGQRQSGQRRGSTAGVGWVVAVSFVNKRCFRSRLERRRNGTSPCCSRRSTWPPRSPLAERWATGSASHDCSRRRAGSARCPPAWALCRTCR